MKSFKFRDGKVQVDGVIYGPTPTDVEIMGSMGKIQSIMIPGKGQFFPIRGTFEGQSLIPTTDTTTENVVTKPKSLKKTELVESSGKAMDESGNPIRKRSKKATK